MKNALDKCAAALKKVEWVEVHDGASDTWVLKCPACNAYKSERHRPSCIVRDALATLSSKKVGD